MLLSPSSGNVPKFPPTSVGLVLISTDERRMAQRGVHGTWALFSTGERRMAQGMCIIPEHHSMFLPSFGAVCVAREALAQQHVARVKVRAELDDLYWQHSTVSRPPLVG